MEYSFRSSRGSEITSLFLDDYRIILRQGGVEEVIPYASIVAIRVNKSRDRFVTHISPDGRRPLVVLSQSVSENGSRIDQSGGYSLFVRVLHRHLNEKSTAVFRSGRHPDTLLWSIGATAVISFLLSVSLGYFGVRLLNPYLQASVFSVVAAIIVVALSARKLPRTYHPGSIPLQFLP